MYNSNMDKNMGAFRRGFTIIEVMLFLALSGLLLVGILGGLGGNIARQRYSDAVEDIVNMFRDQYSFVADTQISTRARSDDSSCYGLVTSDFGSEDAIDYFRIKAGNTPDSISYRGRTNCVVYGAVVTINEDYIETTELLGRDYQAVVRDKGIQIPENTTDLEILQNYLSANNMSFHCSEVTKRCFVRSADNTRIQSKKWGVKMQEIGNKETGEILPLRKTLLIFRSPRDGSIRTYVWDGVVEYGGNVVKYSDINQENNGLGIENSNALDDYGINKHLSQFTMKDLDICVDSGDGQTYNGARRMIKIQRGGRGQNAVELINLDVEKDENEGGKLGEQSCD